MFENDDILYKRNMQISTIFNHLEPCPCTLAHAYWDYTKFRLQSEESAYCFTQQVPYDRSIQQCCYSYMYVLQCCQCNILIYFLIDSKLMPGPNLNHC